MPPKIKVIQGKGKGRYPCESPRTYLKDVPVCVETLPPRLRGKRCLPTTCCTSFKMFPTNDQFPSAGKPSMSNPMYYPSFPPLKPNDCGSSVPQAQAPAPSFMPPPLPCLIPLCSPPPPVCYPCPPPPMCYPCPPPPMCHPPPPVCHPPPPPMSHPPPPPPMCRPCPCETCRPPPVCPSCPPPLSFPKPGSSERQIIRVPKGMPPLHTPPPRSRCCPQQPEYKQPPSYNNCNFYVSKLPSDLDLSVKDSHQGDCTSKRKHGCCGRNCRLKNNNRIIEDPSKAKNNGSAWPSVNIAAGDCQPFEPPVGYPGSERGIWNDGKRKEPVSQYPSTSDDCDDGGLYWNGGTTKSNIMKRGPPTRKMYVHDDVSYLSSRMAVKSQSQSRSQSQTPSPSFSPSCSPPTKQKYVHDDDSYLSSRLVVRSQFPSCSPSLSPSLSPQKQTPYSSVTGSSQTQPAPKEKKLERIFSSGFDCGPETNPTAKGNESLFAVPHIPGRYGDKQIKVGSDSKNPKDDGEIIKTIKSPKDDCEIPKSSGPKPKTPKSPSTSAKPAKAKGPVKPKSPVRKPNPRSKSQPNRPLSKKDC